MTRTAVSVLAQTSSSRLDSVVVAAKRPELGNGGGGVVSRCHGIKLRYGLIDGAVVTVRVRVR
jgi:hypothetical protein